jgi:hypothetical protein
MPRERRIEYAGAIYHAMARGNRRADILGDSDRCRFVETLEEALEASGWVLYGWVLISKGDWRKGLVAGLIRKRSLVDNGWLARHLAMGSRTAVSRIMGQARQRMQDDRKARGLGRRLKKRSRLA